MAARMGGMMGFVLLGLLLFAMTANGQDSLADKNKRDIDEHQNILKDKVMTDLQKLKEKFTDLVKHVNDKLTLLRAYTTDSIQKLKEDADTNMKAGDTTLKENTDKLEGYIREKINDLNAKMVENLEALSTASSDQRNFIRDWNDKRSKRHENILGTHVSLCAFDHGDFAAAKDHVVTYNSVRGGFLDQHKSWQVLAGPKNNDETKAMEVLNRETGKFKVPTHAAGLYMFTFSVTMDTADFNTEPSQYQFEKNGIPIPGTSIYSDAGLPHPVAGKTSIYDKVPGSNTIFLKLEQDDEVGVRQTRDTDIPDFHVSFCGTLIHLETASESPGGLWADPTNVMEFPTATEAGITTIDNTPESYDDLDLSNFTETNVARINTNLTDTLGETDITASDPSNWRASTWDEKHHL
jgi:hypothetical protein